VLVLQALYGLSDEQAEFRRAAKALRDAEKGRDCRPMALC